VTQLWSFAGVQRTAVNQTSTEVDLSYNFESGWYIQSDPTITYNWSAVPHEALTHPNANDLTVPAVSRLARSGLLDKGKTAARRQAYLAASRRFGLRVFFGRKAPRRISLTGS